MKSALRIALVVAVLALTAGWVALRFARAPQEVPVESASRAESAREALSVPTPMPMPVGATSEPRSEVASVESTADLPTPRTKLRVLDEQSGESVPFLAMSVSVAGGDSEEVMTDSDGIATFAAREGTLAIEIQAEGTPEDLVQSVRPPAHLAGEPIALELSGESPQDLRVPLGPTWRLILNGAPSVEATRFRATFASADPRKAFDKVFAMVHDGDPTSQVRAAASPRFSGPWIRFGPLARIVSGGPPWRLSMLSDDGLWAGRADVDANTGVQPAALSIVLEPRAKLSGHVIDSALEPVRQNWIQLWPPGGSFDDPAKRPLLSLTDRDGVYNFGGIAPGAYTLKTTLKGHADFASEVQVAPLAATSFDIALATAANARVGRVAGRVRSQSGTYHGELKAAMSLRHPPTLESTKVIWEETPSGQLGHFAFEGVSEDGPKVNLFGPDLYALDPSERIAAPFAADELVFTVLDAAASVELSFAVQAKGSETRVQRFEVFVQTNLDSVPRRTTLRTENAVARVRGIAVGARYTWRLRVDGFAPTWGEGVAPPSDSTLILEPRKGFGIEVLASDDSSKPLDGARVIFDGSRVATTDADGVAHAYAEEPPKKILVAWKDWIPAARSAVKPDGSWQAFQDRLLVVLQAP